MYPLVRFILDNAGDAVKLRMWYDCFGRDCEYVDLKVNGYGGNGGSVSTSLQVNWPGFREYAVLRAGLSEVSATPRVGAEHLLLQNGRR